MSNKVLEIREKAIRYLGETRIADGEAEINKILLDLSETDEQDLDIKLQTLENIHNYLLSKSKLKLLNSDLTFLQEFASSLRKNDNEQLKNIKENKSIQLEKLLDIIKRNY